MDSTYDNANGKDSLLLRHAICKHLHVSFYQEDQDHAILPRQYGYHTSWYLSRWCHLSPLTETKATCKLSTTLLTVKTQCCKKMDTFKINFILIVVLMNIVYNCFSIIRCYVTAIYVMFYWKINYKHFF